MATYINRALYKYGEFIVVRSRYSNTLKSYLKILLNKDDVIGESQIPVTLWQCVSSTIPLAKHVHLCKIYSCLPLLFCFLEHLMYAFWWEAAIAASRHGLLRRAETDLFHARQKMAWSPPGINLSPSGPNAIVNTAKVIHVQCTLLLFFSWTQCKQFVYMYFEIRKSKYSGTSS